MPCSRVGGGAVSDGAIIALAYALATALAFSLPTTTTTAPNEGTAPHPLQDLIDGFRYVAITPWVAISVTFAATMTLLTVGPLEVLLPTLLRHGHDNGAAVYGAVLAALGCGRAALERRHADRARDGLP